MGNKKIELSLFADLIQLEQSRNVIIEALNEIVGQQEWNYELMLALEEALVNIIEHGMKGMEDPPSIILNLEIKNHVLRMELIDKGTPFDSSKKKEIDLEEHYKAYKSRGLGVFLIQNIMDNVSYDYDPLVGNKLIMEKNL